VKGDEKAEEETTPDKNKQNGQKKTRG